ncbi:MAG: TMEM175 family protein [Pseudomonadota bacterium]
MSTHATATRQWTNKELDKLQREDGFRLRGLETTRLDTFIDAAFAFVLTLLVISFDDIPSNREELVEATKRIPAFAASFATLMMFWLSHRTWSRRYGLETRSTVIMSLSLIFVVLVYVYPLRAIFEGMFDSISGGFLQSSFAIDDFFTLRLMFGFYSIGFLAMSVLMQRLYAAATLRADELGLDTVERRQTRIDQLSWVYSNVFAIVSIAIAAFTPDGIWITGAGYIYFVMLATRPFMLRLLHNRWASANQAAQPARAETGD